MKITLKIDGLSHDGRGVGRMDGKAVFVTGAIPGDTVLANIHTTQKTYDDASLVEVTTPSPERVEPFCPSYHECGGCQLQHMSLSAQLTWKAKNIYDTLAKSINMTHCEISEPMTDQDQGYRRRARFVLGKNKTDENKPARFGFRAKSSNHIVDITHCPVLEPSINASLTKIREEKLPLASRSPKDITVVSTESGVVWTLDKDAETGSVPTHQYQLNNLTLSFPPTGFIQANAKLNQQMVNRAVAWLDVQPNHQVLDLFCGVGNFTLPIAEKAKRVVGIEGELALVQTAQLNAEQNNLTNTQFFKANLFEEHVRSEWFLKQKYNRILLDPGRPGAAEICQQIGKLKADKIVMVSCNVSTLIRDITILQEQSYLLKKITLIDMFPHTTHTEVIALLEKGKKAPKKRAPGIFKI